MNNINLFSKINDFLISISQLTFCTTECRPNEYVFVITSYGREVFMTSNWQNSFAKASSIFWSHFSQDPPLTEWAFPLFVISHFALSLYYLLHYIIISYIKNILKNKQLKLFISNCFTFQCRQNTYSGLIQIQKLTRQFNWQYHGNGFRDGPWQT